jgi:hypothetical protein
LTISDISFTIHDLRGKHNLIKKLPQRLKGYFHILEYQRDWKIVVLVDEDREDCIELKNKLEEIARNCGLVTKTKNRDNFQILNRIVVEELESWFFGDITAIRENYPRVSENLSNKRAYRIPDEIKGGTWEALERVLSNAGYYTKGFYPKTEVARKISPFLNPENNSSKSFKVFQEGLKELVK